MENLLGRGRGSPPNSLEVIPPLFVGKLRLYTVYVIRKTGEGWIMSRAMVMYFACISWRNFDDFIEEVCCGDVERKYLHLSTLLLASSSHPPEHHSLPLPPDTQKKNVNRSNEARNSQALGTQTPKSHDR
jgi:hypothetical protein